MTVTRITTEEEVNRIVDRESNGALRGIIAYAREELVSTDFNGNENSAVVDATLTKVIGGNLLRVVAWYDNEAAFSQHLVELVMLDSEKVSIRLAG